MPVKFICDNPACTNGDGGTVLEADPGPTQPITPAVPEPPTGWTTLVKEVEGAAAPFYYCSKECYEAVEGGE